MDVAGMVAKNPAVGGDHAQSTAVIQPGRAPRLRLARTMNRDFLT